MTGKLYWEEVWFRDNSSNPDGVQVVESEKKVVRTVTISQFNESTKQTIENTKQSASASAEVGASYSVVSATVKTEISAAKEITDTYSYTAKEQRDMSIEETIIDKTACEYGQWRSLFYNLSLFPICQLYLTLWLVTVDEIKGGGKLGLYQAYFQAPGIGVSLNQIRTGGERPPSQDVELNVQMRELNFISSLEVWLVLQ